MYVLPVDGLWTKVVFHYKDESVPIDLYVLWFTQYSGKVQYIFSICDIGFIWTLGLHLIIKDRKYQTLGLLGLWKTDCSEFFMIGAVNWPVEC